MRAITILLLVLTIAGCGDLHHRPVIEAGRTRRIQLYSGKEKVGEWKTSGNIEINADSYYFKDDLTGRTISIRGTVVIEVE